MMQGFRVLAALKGLRGTAFDVFGYSAERRLEKKLLAQYESDLDLIARRLSASSVEAATALLSVPALIRGFGHVKHAAIERTAAERARLIERFVGMEASPKLQAAE
jgi:indolepyruvate ferredoxin oxidoreductase